MTRDIFNQLSTAFESLGWNHTGDFTAGEIVIRLGISELTGDGVMELFNVLAPKGVPVPGIVVSLAGSGLLVS